MSGSQYLCTALYTSVIFVSIYFLVLVLFQFYKTSFAVLTFSFSFSIFFYFLVLVFIIFVLVSVFVNENHTVVYLSLSQTTASRCDGKQASKIAGLQVLIKFSLLTVCVTTAGSFFSQRG